MMKYLVLLLCYHALVDEIAAFGSMGPIGNIIINSVYDCSDEDKPTGDDIILKANFVNENGEKYLEGTLESKIDVTDDTINYMIDIKKFEGGNWKPFYNVKGKPCTDLDRYIKKLWRKFTGSVEPKLDPPCPIPAGNYKMTKFQATAQDIGINSIFYGKLQLKIAAKDKNGKPVMCIMGEGDSQAP